MNSWSHEKPPRIAESRKGLPTPSAWSRETQNGGNGTGPVIDLMNMFMYVYAYIYIYMNMIVTYMELDFLYLYSKELSITMLSMS